MRTTPEQLAAECGLPEAFAADLGPALSALRDLAPAAASPPSAALAALLADPPRPVMPRSRRRLAVIGSAAAALSSLALTGVAAAANELPEPAQRLVAQLSERYLPFHFPQPRDAAGPGAIDESPEPAPPTQEGGAPDPSGAGSPESTQPGEPASVDPAEPGVTAPSPDSGVGKPTEGAPPSAEVTEAPESVPADPEADLTGSQPQVGTGPEPGGGPAAEEPTAQEPTAEEPAAHEPTTGNETTGEPTTEQPDDAGAEEPRDQPSPSPGAEPTG